MPWVQLFIDGAAVSVSQEFSILEAVRAQGRDLPTLCHVSGLPSRSVCRLCLVRIEGQGRPVPACSAPVREGMVVRTDAPDLMDVRRHLMEMILAEHGPCVGECEVTRLAGSLGVEAPPGS